MKHLHSRVACLALVLMAGPMTVSAADATTSAGTADLDALFPSFADGHTAGLWLFDEPQYLNMTLTDAGREMYDLRLLAGGRLEPGRFGNALKCSAQSGPAGRESCRASTTACFQTHGPSRRPNACWRRWLAKHGHVSFGSNSKAQARTMPRCSSWERATCRRCAAS